MSNFQKKIPNFKHEFPQKDYDSVLRKIEADLILLREVMENKIDQSKHYILGVYINKIYDTLVYYYSTKTWRLNIQKNHNFKKTSKDIRNLSKKHIHSKKERDIIDQILKRLNQYFVEQMEYIEKLVTKIKKKKKSEFEK